MKKSCILPPLGPDTIGRSVRYLTSTAGQRRFYRPLNRFDDHVGYFAQSVWSKRTTWSSNLKRRLWAATRPLWTTFWGGGFTGHRDEIGGKGPVSTFLSVFLSAPGLVAIGEFPASGAVVMWLVLCFGIFFGFSLYLGESSYIRSVSDDSVLLYFMDLGAYRTNMSPVVDWDGHQLAGIKKGVNWHVCAYIYDSSI